MSPPVTKRTNSMKNSVSRGLNKVCVSRGLNKVCVSRGLNKVCVSRGLKAQQFHGRAEGPKVPSPGQAKRRPGFGMRVMCAPCKGKSLCLLYTFALTGRSYICIHNPGRRFACPGLGNCWAFSPRSHRARPSLAFTTQGAASIALG